MWCGVLQRYTHKGAEANDEAIYESEGEREREREKLQREREGYKGWRRYIEKENAPVIKQT